jgi:hypothetical protein
MIGCDHARGWYTDGQCPLHCQDCGVLWPGHQLPKPEPGRNEGYGALAEQPSWRSRVDAMVAGLEDA